MTYPEELVELADTLRKMGVTEFRYGSDGAHVRFGPGAASIANERPEVVEERRTEKGKGKELPLPDNFDGLDLEELLG